MALGATLPAEIEPLGHELPEQKGVEGAYSELVARIEAARKQMGWSERQLCLEAGVPVNAVRTIRNGHAPKLSVLKAIASRLGIAETRLVEASPEVRIDLDEPNAGGFIRRGQEPHGTESGISSAGQNREGMPLSGHVLISPVPGGGRLGGSDRPAVIDVAFPATLIEEKLWGRSSDFYWAEVAGSVMAPDLLEGDQVLVDRRSIQPVQPGMFVLDEGIGLTARWIEYIPGTAPRLYRVRCSDLRFSPYDIAADRIRILGRIVWVGRAL